MIRGLFVLLLLSVAGFTAGCNKSLGTKADPIEFSGRVTMNNQPVSGVVFNLQAVAAGGAQAACAVKDGNVKGHVVPGRYTFFISEGNSPQMFAAIPEKYRLGAMDRQFDVAAGQTLDIKLD